MPQNIRPVCRAPGCDSTDLIEAHIIPRGFARDMMGEQKHKLIISKTSVRPTQHGVYDRNLLCANCDRQLGDLDNRALDVCRRFPDEHQIIAGDCFIMENVDGDMFATFILSVLWRASISTRPEFRTVSLGPYEEAQAGEVSFGMRPLKDFPAYQLMVGRYLPRKGFDPARNYSAPARSNFNGLNGWGFSLHGFKIMAKFDRRQLSAVYRPAIVNCNTRLTGAFVDYLSTVEGRAMLDMAAARRARRIARPARNTSQ
jgi:hypothetical protein